MKRILLALLCTLTAVGTAATPGKTASSSATKDQAATQDPVTEFKAMIATASATREWTKVRRHIQTGKWSKLYFTLGQVKFDVKKTDSLVSTAMGLVSFPIEVRQSEFFDTEHEATQSTSLSKLRATFYYSGKYLLDGGSWKTDQFTYYASVGDNPPDPTTATLTRDELMRDRDNVTRDAELLRKWIR